MRMPATDETKIVTKKFVLGICEFVCPTWVKAARHVRCHGKQNSTFQMPTISDVTMTETADEDYNACLNRKTKTSAGGHTLITVEITCALLTARQENETECLLLQSTDESND